MHAHFQYLETRADAFELVQTLTDLQAADPSSHFSFYTHPDENAIGIIQYTSDERLTTEALEAAWRTQSHTWIDDEDPEFDLDWWIASWSVIEPSSLIEPAHEARANDYLF
jgi:hypothetical protein